jgi:hypothetical protein
MWLCQLIWARGSTLFVFAAKGKTLFVHGSMNLCVTTSMYFHACIVVFVSFCLFFFLWGVSLLSPGQHLEADQATMCFGG